MKVDSKKRFPFSKLIVILSCFCLIFLVYLIMTKDIVRTEGINIYYRTYSKEKGWTRWSQNGQINGNKKYAIKAIEIKVKSKNKGNIFYNTYSNKEWMLNDSYSGKTSGDMKNDISKIKMMLSDTLYNKYIIKYRFYTDGRATDYSKNYEELTGEKPVNQIQIVVEKKE